MQTGPRRPHSRDDRAGHAGGHGSRPCSYHTKNSPESAPLVSRANSSERPLGENSAPTSMSPWLTSGPSFDRGAQPVSVRRVSYRSPSAMMIIRDPSGEGSGSYSSPEVFTAAPRFSSVHFPDRSERARQMSVPPSPPGRSDPKYSQPPGPGRGNHSAPGEFTGSGRRVGAPHLPVLSRSIRQMSRSLRLAPFSERVEMKYRVRPSAVKYGSASTPSPANAGDSGAVQPAGVQRLTRIRQPANCGELRTK